MTTTPPPCPPPLRHLGEIDTFVVEGYLYADDADRHYYVFTAGDRTLWQASEVLDDPRRSHGRLLVGWARSHDDCSRQLAAAIPTR